MANLSIINKSVLELKPYKNNSRTHSDKQIQQIANSIKEFGFNCPIVIDANAQIVAGHGRVEAAKRLGIQEVPTICVSHLNDDQIRAFVIADNKMAQNAGWDKGLLKLELQHLTDIEVNFDVEITGFSTPEIDVIIGNPVLVQQPQENAIPAMDGTNTITQLGDIWEFGRHRLSCGNSLEPTTFETLLEGKKAHMVFTDPPYNVPIDGHVGGLGKTKHREFAMATGEMTEAEFISFLSSSFQYQKKHSVDGSLHYICMDWRHVHEMMIASKAIYTEMKNLCVWAKDNGGMGSLYRSRHELIFVFKNGKGRHLNNVELGKHGRYRTNVWEYAGVNTARKGRMAELSMHPTVKPVAMIADAIKDCTKHGEAVLDPFAGSGSTLIATEKTGRCGYAIEIDPHYCDVIVRRWQAYTGKDAIHFATGETFNSKAKKGGGNE